MTNRVEELLPCPFCGERLEEEPETSLTYRCWSHPHGNCLMRDTRIVDEQADTETEIAAWNRRTAISPDGVEERGWKPIETAPKDGTDILVFVGSSEEQFAAYYDRGSWVYAIDKFGTKICCDASLWRSLPEPPAISAEGDE